MTPRARKTFGLSWAVLALAAIHFYIAYQFIKTSSGGFNVGATMFIALGVLQVALGGFGLVAALRRNQN